MKKSEMYKKLASKLPTSKKQAMEIYEQLKTSLCQILLDENGIIDAAYPFLDMFESMYDFEKEGFEFIKEAGWGEFGEYQMIVTNNRKLLFCNFLEEKERIFINMPV